ncbi:MAG: NBR1-Ig-like domain-containing protein [Anaerolineae bacterium]
MKKLLQVSLSFVIMGMLLSACGPFVRVANGLDAPTVEPTVAPTNAPTAAPTIAPTVAPTVAPTQEIGGQSCTDSAAFVKDVSVPDNVLFSPGTPFTKTWRLKNTGTCVWDSSYLVYWISGATMTQQPGYFIVPAGQSVQPGESVDVSVGMTAPMEVGYYTSYWGLKGRAGQFMPIARGAAGNSFFVKIRVSDSGSSGLPGARIVDQQIDIELEQGSGEACTPEATYLVHAYVKADGPLSALYEIDSTAGQISAGYFIDDSGAKQTTVEGTVKFDSALFAADGAPIVPIVLRFVGPYPYPRDIQVNFWVDGGQWVSAKVDCP